MPEGDTIFRTARALGRALVGHPITGFRSNYPLLTRFHDDTPLTGPARRSRRVARQMAAHLISPAAAFSPLTCS